MRNVRATTSFSSREFIARIRLELSQAGRMDIQVQRSWIDADERDDAFVLNVPVGAEATVPLRQRHEGADVDMAEGLERQAEYFAAALINLKAAEEMLLSYAREIRDAACAAVETARSGGLDIQLVRVGFRPVSAWQLAGEDWKEAAYHVLAAVSIRHLGFHLRPETSTFWVEEAHDVVKEMEGVLSEQRERQDRLAELEACGADFTVHQITLDILAAHGISAPDALAGVRDAGNAYITVQHAGHDLPLTLLNHHGEVTISMAMRNAVWNGRHLWFLGDEESKDHGHLVGGTLGDLVRHPAFTSRPITEVVRRSVDHMHFDLSEKLLFDAEDGRLWRDERLAA